MRLLLTCACVCIAQVDSKLSGFVAALSEVSSVTDPIYGPDSIGVGGTEISSLTDPTYYGPGSSGKSNAGVDEGAIAVADAAVVGVGVDGGGGSESGASDSCATWVTYDGDVPPLDWAPDPDDAWTWSWGSKGNRQG